MMKSKLLVAGLVIALLAAFSLLSETSSALQAEPEHFQKTFAVAPGAVLDVENYKGTIHVTAADGNQLTVEVQKRFEGSDSDRKWWMENVSVAFQNDANHVRVKVEYPNQNCTFCFENHDYTAAVELEIRVPRQTNVNLDGYKPDITISGVQGDISVKSYKAPILIEETTGAVRVDTYKNTIRLRDVKIRGTLSVKSYKADAEVSARDLGESADLENEKGDITVRVPANAGLDVDYAGGRRASFHSDFPLSVSGSFSDSVHGSINGGGTKLRLRTVKGTVTLQKVSGEL